MGKSKRIRAERARAVAANPDKYVKSTKSEKNAKLVTIVIVAIVAAIVLGLAAVAIAQSTGLILRAQTAYSAEGFSINGTMLSYLYYTQYNYMYSLYYQYMGSSVTNYLSSIQSSASTSAKSQAEQIIKLCVAAKNSGIELDADDLAEIDETIKDIEDSAKESNTSISAAYGNVGLNISDIRAMLELSTLASKYSDIKLEELKNGVKDNDAELKKFVEEHMSLFYKADYLTYTADTKEVVNAFLTLKTSDEFKTEVIRLAIENKFDSEFKTATSKLEAKDLPVASLKTALKAVVLAELKYSLLEIEIEGLEFEDKSTTKDRIKLIFEKLYGTETFTAGEDDSDKATATTVSDALYDALNTACGKISTNAKTAVTNAEKLEQAYALPDLADEKDESESEDEDEEESKPTEAQLWIFDSARKEGESIVITNKPEKETDKETYTVYLIVKPNYLDTEITKDVGHILVKVDQQTETSSMTDEEKAEIKAENEKAYADAKVKADEIYNQIKGLSKDEFEKIAEEKTDDSGVFFESVHTGDMVEEFEDWTFDENRKPGDNDIVKTKYGWHIMYFVGNSYEAWKADAIENYVNEQYNDWFEALETELNFKVTVNANTVANVCG